MTSDQNKEAARGDETAEQPRKRGFVGRLWHRLWTPSRYSFAALMLTGIILGIIGWGGFNWALEATNNEAFCISCHEMKNNVYEEYRETPHFSNRSGVRATCPDCHVPKEWIHKIIRKIQASNEIYHKLMGTIDTREKFLNHRLELAMHVWKTMKETNSRECRNCHDEWSMDFDKQQSRSADRHEAAFDEGKTCIDCHKGIAHQLPKGWEKAAKAAGLQE